MITLALLVCIIGCLLYLLLNQPEYSKLAELGRIMFAIGLLVVLRSMGAAAASTLVVSNNVVEAAVVLLIVLAVVICITVRRRQLRGTK